MRNKIQRILRESSENDMHSVHVTIHNKEHYQKMLANEIVNLVSLSDASHYEKEMQDDKFIITASFPLESRLEKFKGLLNNYMNKRYPETKYDISEDK